MLNRKFSLQAGIFVAVAKIRYIANFSPAAKIPALQTASICFFSFIPSL